MTVCTQKMCINLIPKSSLNKTKLITENITETTQQHVISLMNFLINRLQIRLSLIKLNKVTTELLGIWIENALLCRSVRFLVELYD
jgi:hypothetical protein